MLTFKPSHLKHLLLSFVLSATLSAIGTTVQDEQSNKSSTAVACCANLVNSGGLITTAPADGASSWNSIGLQKVGTVSLNSGAATASGGGGTPVAGASNYFSDANSISGTGLYGATSGSGTWTVPAGVTKLQVVIVGGGGDGGPGHSIGGRTNTYFGGGGGGSGYVIAKTAYVTAGTQIPWSVGAHNTQSCFNGWCAAGGLDGGLDNGGNGGSGGGAGGQNASGGGGGGYGGAGGAGALYQATSWYTRGGDGGSRGLNGGINSGTLTTPNATGSGQGSYSTVVTAPLTAKLFSTGTSSTFAFTSGGSGSSSGGTGYGGGGGGATASILGNASVGLGGNGAIFVWTE